MRKYLKKLVSKIETSLSLKNKIIFGSFVVVLISTLSLLLVTTSPSMPESTVMIVKTHEFGGGTGVILTSEKNKSIILTNSHVCEAVKNGGIVKTSTGEEHLVVSFIKSKLHDLCTIQVAANLKINTKLAKSSPNLYETAFVSGHPNLLPLTITKGHFSGKRIIDVLIGFRECKENENSMFCAIFGKAPIVKDYEAQLVTATIMAGSSGSAVYNENKELSALVFAGSGQLSYAFTVPYESIISFLKEERNNLPVELPNNELNFNNENSTNLTIKEKNKLNSFCNSAEDKKVLHLCEIIKRDLFWRMQ